MKTKLLLPVLALLALSCGSGQVENTSQENKTTSKNNVKFSPKQKTSSLSDSERKAAIAEKRSTLAEVNVDSLIKSTGVKFSILPPAVSEELPLNASDKLCNRMILFASQNGVSGLCTNPVLAMVARVVRTESGMTNDVVQKTIVKYDVTYYCGNLITNDIYASCSQSLTGVGPNLETAASQAFNNLENDNQIQRMFSTASERAIEWYSQTSTIKSIVEQYVAERNYALALAMLNSVPSQADSTYAYASERSLELSVMMFEDEAANLFAGMQDMIANNDKKYNPEVGAIYRLISPHSAVYPEARKIFDEYMVQLREFDKSERARLDEIAKDERNKAHELALEEMEIRKITAPIEAKAAIEQLKIEASVQKSTAWSQALSSSAASIAHGMRGGMFGENGMFGKGGILGIGSFAEPISKAVDGVNNTVDKLTNHITKN